MTFTKKHTHTISLRNGQTFDWHLHADWTYKNRSLVIKGHNMDGQYLIIEPYGFMPAQTSVRSAIRTALRMGWTPAQKKAPMCLTYTAVGWLPTLD